MIRQTKRSASLLLVGWTSLVVSIALLSVAPTSTTAFVIPSRRAGSRSRIESQAIDSENPTFLFTRNVRSQLQRNTRSPKIAGDLQVSINGPKQPLYLEEQAVLECTSFGVQGMPSLYWLKNGEPIPQSENLVSRSVNENVKDKVILTEVRSKLYIDCATAADEAEYTCVAVADRKYSANFKLQVTQAPAIVPSQYCRTSVKKAIFRPRTPARISMYTYNKMATIGANVILACRVQGSNVALSWFFDNEDNNTLRRLPENSRFHVLDNGDLEIKDVQWEDVGGYVCVAENEVGTDRQEAFLYPLASSGPPMQNV